jgi:LacI family transcriptional regulator
MSTKKSRAAGRPRLQDAAAAQRGVTIKDVAEACGVAVSTVSNALTGRRFVVEETKQQILRTAERVGYRASPIARGLRLQRVWTIGFLVGDISNPYFPEMVRGAESVLSAQHYSLTLCDTDYRVEKQDAYMQMLRDRRLDGLIVASQAEMGEGLVDLVETGFPLVFINQQYAGVETDYVGVDNSKGVDEACKHLWSLGHRRIGFVRGREGSTAAHDRLECFKRSIVSLSGKFDDSYVVPGDYTYESGVFSAKRLLSREDRPTALIAANDLSALGAMAAAEALGLQIPTDVSIVGIDDIFVSALSRISLTSVNQPKWELGAAAARMLLERIAEGRKERKEVVLESRLVKRGSSGPAPL